MTIIVQDVRNGINIPETTELSNDVIQSAIDRAEFQITVLQTRFSAPAAFYSKLHLPYAMYLAYEAYADRVLNVQPGQYVEGKWEPIAEEIVRNTSDKLAMLRKQVEDIVGIIQGYPKRPFGTFQHGTAPTQVFSIGMMNYGTEETDTHDVI